jgi:hypothetical protein
MVRVGARNLRVTNTHMVDKVNFMYFKQLKAPATQLPMKRHIIRIMHNVSKSVTKFKHTLLKVQR